MSFNRKTALKLLGVTAGAAATAFAGLYSVAIVKKRGFCL